MDIQQLIDRMEKLLKLHKSLLELALKKTAILEAEDTEALTELMKDEQAHILAIEKIEKERRKAAEGLAPGKRTMTEIIHEVSDSEQQQILAEISQELQDVIARLQKQNELNQQLISQALKFISFTMSLVEPSQDDYNYGKNETGGTGQSLFNSKA